MKEKYLQYKTELSEIDKIQWQKIVLLKELMQLIYSHGLAIEETCDFIISMQPTYFTETDELYQELLAIKRFIDRKYKYINEMLTDDIFNLVLVDDKNE